MVTKCANPRCNHRFKYSGEGKLFYLDRRTTSPAIERLFWLCSDCVAAYTLVFDHHTIPYLVPRPGIEKSKPGADAL
jgi:hypothetical protein